MHATTEDLLSVRDGEPVDARTSEVIAADASYGSEIERLRRMRTDLRSLPDFEAPEGLWERIDAAEHTSRPGQRPWLRRFAGAALAAAVAAAAIYLVLPRVPEADGSAPPQVFTASPGRVEPGSFATLAPGLPGARVVPVSYTQLVEESARLERVLGQISYQRPLMNGATATTIAGLEDRISVIDEQLTFSTARGLPQPEREALWSERVDLMGALVHVRFAQAQPTGF